MAATNRAPLGVVLELKKLVDTVLTDNQAPFHIHTYEQ